MSTTMRNVRLATQGEPISRGQSAAASSWRRGLADLERWATAKPAIAALTLRHWEAALAAAELSVLLDLPHFRAALPLPFKSARALIQAMHHTDGAIGPQTMIGYPGDVGDYLREIARQ